MEFYFEICFASLLVVGHKSFVIRSPRGCSGIS